mmetsp:Transcript_28371/g.53567  ORF Transcript_28371/g.53567 Transcript_28371/m.53567 type:complete len:104 (-) Transcript_28371:5549-5860(-)
MNSWVIWAINVWIKSKKDSLSSAIHHLSLNVVGVFLWLRTELVTQQIITLIFFAAAVALFWIEHRHSTKKLKRYNHRTSHASAIGVNRQVLEEATSVKQNDIK